MTKSDKINLTNSCRKQVKIAWAHSANERIHGNQACAGSKNVGKKLRRQTENLEYDTSESPEEKKTSNVKKQEGQ